MKSTDNPLVLRIQNLNEAKDCLIRALNALTGGHTVEHQAEAFLFASTAVLKIAQADYDDQRVMNLCIAELQRIQLMERT